MAPKPVFIPVAKPKVTYKGPFDLRRLYLMMREFMLEEGYLDQFRGDYYLEPFFQVQRKPGGKTNMRFWWRGKNIPGSSTFYRYVINVDVFITAMTDVDIVRNNQKMSVQKAEILITLEGKLQVDPQMWFQTNFLLKPFRHMFEKVLMKRQTEYHWVKVLEDVQKLETEIKTHLSLTNSGGVERKPYFRRF